MGVHRHCNQGRRENSLLSRSNHVQLGTRLPNIHKLETKVLFSQLVVAAICARAVALCANQEISMRSLAGNIYFYGSVSCVKV